MAEILVLGAGMVGVASALELQRRGHAVTLIDRRAPGQETSYGNAGLIQTEAVEPYAMPLAIADLARIAAGRSPDVRWRLGEVMRQGRALAAYAWQSRGAGHRRATAVYRRLIPEAARYHAPLIEAAGAEALIRRSGYLELHRNAAALDRGAATAERFARDYGVGVRVLDSAGLAALEPAIRTPMAGATHWRDTWSCTDPGGLVAAYAALFVARGGRLVTGDARTLRQVRSGWTAAGETGEHAVVALGPWTSLGTSRIASSMRLVYKRGYHRHLAVAVPPGRPVFDPANGVVLSPMLAGLRVCTAADLSEKAHPAPPQLIAGEAAARELFGSGEPVEAKPWSGLRPCTPHMLPIVGAVPDQRGLWAHFGHGHHGFTLGPRTAAILADAIDGIGGWPELAPRRDD